MRAPHTVCTPCYPASIQQSLHAPPGWHLPGSFYSCTAAAAAVRSPAVRIGLILRCRLAAVSRTVACSKAACCCCCSSKATAAIATTPFIASMAAETVCSCSCQGLVVLWRQQRTATACAVDDVVATAATRCPALLLLSAAVTSWCAAPALRGSCRQAVAQLLLICLTEHNAACMFCLWIRARLLPSERQHRLHCVACVVAWPGGQQPT